MAGPRPAGRLHVVVLAPDGVRRPAGLAAWLAGIAPRGSRGELTVALVSDRRMRSLNRTFRGVDRATDVLSFAGEPPQLGDIVIATGVAARQAREAGHALGTEVRVLALHGLLHLLGFDHDGDDGAMARVEQRLRRRGGLSEGLIERVSPPRRRGAAGDGGRRRR
ncbi:MAG: rRNA maturation RNase YbeY [Vicinamibacterales bacterium]